MNKKKLEKIMEQEWQKVLKNFNYPEVPEPKLIEGLEMLGFMNWNMLLVGKEWIELLNRKYKMPPEESFNIILSHELVHFTKYPGSLDSMLELGIIAKEILGDRIGEVTAISFVELQDDLYLMQKVKHPIITKLTKILFNEYKDAPYAIGHLNYKLYEELSKENLGVGLNEEGMKAVEKLKNLDYLSKEREVENLRFFTRTIKEDCPLLIKNILDLF